MTEPRKMSFAERLVETDTAEVASNQQNLAAAYRYCTGGIKLLEKQLEAAKELLAEIVAAGDDDEILHDMPKVRKLYDKSRSFGAVI